MRVYLDACALNRPFNDRRQDRIRLEAEAILVALRHFSRGDWDWIGSEILELEIERTPDVERRARMELLMSLVARTVPATLAVAARAAELEALGFGPMDALHAASAEAGRVDVLLSTDDRFVNRAARRATDLRVPVRNPVGWIQEVCKQ